MREIYTNVRSPETVSQGGVVEEGQERVVYGDKTLRVVWQGDRVYFDDAAMIGEPECVLGVSEAQMDEIVRGWQREREQKRDGR